jgi:glycerophosphoryl diester phosphodiesterase
MTKVQIIGHRGAAGTELENTMPSFTKAIEFGVKTIEFDVHITKDNRFVVCHDESLIRVSNTHKRIKDLTYAELSEITLHNGTHVPLLEEVLLLARKHRTAVIVEVKIRRELEALCELLDAFSDLDMIVASFKHDAIAAIRKLRPDCQLYLAEGHHPIEVLQKTRAVKAQGIDLNYKLLNPLTYLMAKRWNLKIMVYTVNNPFIQRCISFFYPDVAICTDHPERFILKPRNLSGTENP